MPDILNSWNAISATEGSAPLFRLPPARPESRASEARSTSGAEPAPHGMRLSPELQALCHRISDASKARQARATKFTRQFSAYQQSDFTGMLKEASRNEKVDRSHPHNLELDTSLRNDRSPVIILDTFGYPQYVFERVDGEWRGFDGALKPLPPDKSNPVDLLRSLLHNGPMGMVYTRYVVNGDVSVLHRNDPEKAGDADSVLSADGSLQPILRRRSQDQGSETDDREQVPSADVSQLSLPLEAYHRPLNGPDSHE